MPRPVRSIPMVTLAALALTSAMGTGCTGNEVVACTDANVQTISASNYDQSCKVDSDCVPIAVGDACYACVVECMTGGAINRSDLSKYQRDLSKTTGAKRSRACPGPAPAPNFWGLVADRAFAFLVWSVNPLRTQQANDDSQKPTAAPRRPFRTERRGHRLRVTLESIDTGTRRACGCLRRCAGVREEGQRKRPLASRHPRTIRPSWPWFRRSAEGPHRLQWPPPGLPNRAGRLASCPSRSRPEGQEQGVSAPRNARPECQGAARRAEPARSSLRGEEGLGYPSGAWCVRTRRGHPRRLREPASAAMRGPSTRRLVPTSRTS